MSITVKQLLESSMFTGNSRVNLPGSLSSNVDRQERHLKELGHTLVRSVDDDTKHEIISTKDGKTYHHTLTPHPDGKWTKIVTTVR